MGKHRAVFESVASHHPCILQRGDRGDGLDPAHCMNGNWPTCVVQFTDTNGQSHRVESEHFVGEEFRRADAGPSRDISIGIGSEQQQMLGNIATGSRAPEQFETAGAEIDGRIGDPGDTEGCEFATHGREVGSGDPYLFGEPRIAPMQPSGGTTGLVTFDTRVVACQRVDTGERR
ncbi:unannotated protein [freshwater metagenome]|uniref:Unannotated protein n=1 Tax=freshwater metagenome TaxID=449393 RepID=A0A6J7JK88_9ZZZZ